MDDSDSAHLRDPMRRALHKYLDAELVYLAEIQQELNDIVSALSDRVRLSQQQKKLHSLDRRTQKHSQLRTAVQQAVRSNFEEELMLSDAIKVFEDPALMAKYQSVQERLSKTATLKRSVDRSFLLAERILSEVLEAFGIQQPSETYKDNGTPAPQSFQSRIDMRS